LSELLTQIVVQWDVSDLERVSPEKNALSALSVVHALEDYLEGQADGLFDVDGHDFGDGTANLFLFADDELVAGAIARLILLAESGEVPANARIAYAIYADEERSDWAYRPIYPAGARGFEIF